MKCTSLPMLSFLLIAFTTFSFPGALDAQSYWGEAVFDIFGHEVVFGEQYYIETSVDCTVYALATARETCPNVVLLNSANGLPVVFTGIIVPREVYLGFRVNMEFSNNRCNASNSLGVPYNINSLLRPGVVVGGLNERAFTITKFNASSERNEYKLSYCPQNILCECSCADLGYYSREALFVSPNDLPFPVVFRPAGTSRRLISPV